MYHDGEYLYDRSLDDRREIMRRAIDEIRRDNSSVAGSERSIVRNPRWGHNTNNQSVAPSEGSVTRNPRHAQVITGSQWRCLVFLLKEHSVSQCEHNAGENTVCHSVKTM